MRCASSSFTGCGVPRFVPRFGGGGGASGEDVEPDGLGAELGVEPGDRRTPVPGRCVVEDPGDRQRGVQHRPVHVPSLPADVGRPVRYR